MKKHTIVEEHILVRILETKVLLTIKHVKKNHKYLPLTTKEKYTKYNMTFGKFTVLILFVLAIGSCKNPEQTTSLNLNGRSSFTLLNDREDSVNIKIENWHNFPNESQEFDTILAPKRSLILDLIIQNYNYYDLTIDSVKYKVFNRPGSNDSVRIADAKSISFLGHLKDINEFLLMKAKKFNSVDADWKPRISSTAGSSLKDLISINDSITKVHTRFISTSDIPTWYRDFELKRLHYLNAGWKLNSLLYRKFLLNIQDTITENFLESLTESLPVSDEELIGNINYMDFLRDYIFFKTYPQLKTEIPLPASKEEYTEFIPETFEVANSELSDLVKDAYLAFIFTDAIRHNKNWFNEKWADLVKDEELREFVNSSLSATQVLPTGSKLPYFYLPDTSNVFHQSDQFIGQIMLINFWATWCKPCIKEFPLENALVEHFKGKPVTILNICIESEPDKWKEMIKKFDLKTHNLLAQENWNKKLNKEFDIMSLPHSVLVDWNGKVVENKCPTARDVKDLISDLLLKMEAEANP